MHQTRTCMLGSTQMFTQNHPQHPEAHSQSDSQRLPPETRDNQLVPLMALGSMVAVLPRTAQLARRDSISVSPPPVVCCLSFFSFIWRAASLLDPRRAAWDACWLEALAAATGAVPAMLARSRNARALNKGFILADVLWTILASMWIRLSLEDCGPELCNRSQR